MGGTIGLIPARGGSRGLPRKNILPLCGKPLVGYSIEAAKEAACIDRILVSTEDAEIAEVSGCLGAEVIPRPRGLAGDKTPTIDVVIHALDLLGEGSVPDLLVLLQPTSPLRTSRDIDAAVDLFRRSACDMVVSVCEPRHPPKWCFTVEGGYLAPLFGGDTGAARRQDLPRVLCPNGAIYIARPEVLRGTGDFFTSRTIPYLMPVERSIDIDTELDLLIAGFLLERDRHP